MAAFLAGIGEDFGTEPRHCRVRIAQLSKADLLTFGVPSLVYF